MRAARLFVSLMVVVPFAGASGVRAEFQLAGSGASMLTAQPPPPITERDDAPARPPTAARTGPGLARGFGHQIPLAFTVRQIVPASIMVKFGDGIDAENLMVDWKGGKPWPDVLRATLRPLGMLVTLRPSEVLIERGSPS